MICLKQNKNTFLCVLIEKYIHNYTNNNVFKVL